MKPLTERWCKLISLEAQRCHGPQMDLSEVGSKPGTNGMMCMAFLVLKPAVRSACNSGAFPAFLIVRLVVSLEADWVVPRDLQRGILKQPKVTGGQITVSPAKFTVMRGSNEGKKGANSGRCARPSIGRQTTTKRGSSFRDGAPEPQTHGTTASVLRLPAKNVTSSSRALPTLTRSITSHETLFFTARTLFKLRRSARMEIWGFGHVQERMLAEAQR